MSAKYVTKGINGFWHSLAFTTGRYPDHIRATPRNKAHCRGGLPEVPRPDDRGNPDRHIRPAETIACVRCHDSVGHLR